ncbi:MAG: hypothetical protein MR644_01790 [Megasphaera elsdenii]|nr:hypothetical protein [Megasphaera elsdenii]
MPGIQFVRKKPAYFFDEGNPPTEPAVVQQRRKLLPLGMKYLFKTFNSFIKPYLSRRDYNGFTLIAVDGTDITSVGNPADAQTFFKSASGGYNLHHVNTLYNLDSHQFIDDLILTKQPRDERKALFILLSQNFVMPFRRSCAYLIYDTDAALPHLNPRKRRRDGIFVYEKRDHCIISCNGLFIFLIDVNLLTLPFFVAGLPCRADEVCEV